MLSLRSTRPHRRSPSHRTGATLLCALWLSAVLAGCATAPPGGERPAEAGQPAEQPEARPQAAEAPTPAPRPSTETATLALLKQSERAAASGDLTEALSYAERAVRIEPRRADLWTRLAALELANEDPGTAIRYARKALTLADDRPDWQRDAWLVIADAREALGEIEEARSIRERWRTARG